MPKLIDPLFSRFHLVTTDPYTSEIYSDLLEPAYNTIRDSYLKAKRKPISLSPSKTFIYAPVKGALIGALRSIVKTAYRNILADYTQLSAKRKQNGQKSPPIDIYFIHYYTNPYNYKRMLRGLKSELLIESTYQATRYTLSTISKIKIRPQLQSVTSNLTFDLARACITNTITASTVYPAVQYLFTNRSMDIIVSKSIRRATIGSLAAAFGSLGLSLVKSVLPSYRKIVSVGLNMLGM